MGDTITGLFEHPMNILSKLVACVNLWSLPKRSPSRFLFSHFFWFSPNNTQLGSKCLFLFPCTLCTVLSAFLVSLACDLYWRAFKVHDHHLSLAFFFLTTSFVFLAGKKQPWGERRRVLCDVTGIQPISGVHSPLGCQVAGLAQPDPQDIITCAITM